MKTELEEKLTESTAHRKSRMSICNYVIRKEKINELTAIAFSTSHENHVKAFCVITSYSIHYTKLYDDIVLLLCTK